MDNSLAILREIQAKETLEQRISNLQDRLQNVEDVIASFYGTPRKPNPFSSWLRTKLGKAQSDKMQGGG